MNLSIVVHGAHHLTHVETTFEGTLPLCFLLATLSRPLLSLLLPFLFLLAQGTHNFDCLILKTSLSIGISSAEFLKLGCSIAPKAVF